jgi:hypothetical protein
VNLVISRAFGGCAQFPGNLMHKCPKNIMGAKAYSYETQHFRHLHASIIIVSNFISHYPLISLRLRGGVVGRLQHWRGLGQLVGGVGLW